MMIKIENLQVIEEAVNARLEKLQPTFNEAIKVEMEAIKTRTQSGVDVNNKPFVAYSDKQGPQGVWKDVRKANNKQTTYVDLKFSGDMFKAMQTTFKKEGFKFLATIFFGDRKQSQKAKGHQTGQLGLIKFEARKFFGLSQSQREAIVSKLRNVK
jgi:hypothetical protein